MLPPLGIVLEGVNLTTKVVDAPTTLLSGMNEMSLMFPAVA